MEYCDHIEKDPKYCTSCKKIICDECFKDGHNRCECCTYNLESAEFILNEAENGLRNSQDNYKRLESEYGKLKNMTEELLEQLGKEVKSHNEDPLEEISEKIRQLREIGNNFKNQNFAKSLPLADIEKINKNYRKAASQMRNCIDCTRLRNETLQKIINFPKDTSTWLNGGLEIIKKEIADHLAKNLKDVNIKVNDGDIQENCLNNLEYILALHTLYEGRVKLLREEINKLENRLSSSIEVEKDKNNEESKAEADFSIKMLEVEALDKEINGCKELLKNTKKMNDEANVTNDTLNKENKSLKDNIEKQKGDLKKLEENVEKLNKTKTDLDNLVNELGEKKRSLEEIKQKHEAINEERDSLSGNIGKLQGEYNKLKNKIKGKKEELGKIKDEIESKKKEKAEICKEINPIEKDAEKNDDHEAKAEISKRLDDKINEKKKILEELKENYMKLSERYIELNGSVDGLVKKINSGTKEYKELCEKCKTSSEEFESIARENANRINDIRKDRNELKEKRDKYENEISKSKGMLNSKLILKFEGINAKKASAGFLVSKMNPGIFKAIFDNTEKDKEGDPNRTVSFINLFKNKDELLNALKVTFDSKCITIHVQNEKDIFDSDLFDSIHELAKDLKQKTALILRGNISEKFIGKVKSTKKGTNLKITILK